MIKILILLLLCSLSFGQEKTIYEKAIEDVDFYFHTLKDVHPDLLFNVSISSFYSNQQKLYKSIDSLSKTGKLNKANLFLLLQKNISQFNDGHTSVFPTEDIIKILSSYNKYIPFTISYLNDQFFIQKCYYSDLNIEKNRIVSINAMSPEKFFNPILNRISGEKIIFKKAIFSMMEEYFIPLEKLNGDTVLLEVEDINFKKNKLLLNSISYSDYLSLTNEFFSFIPPTFNIVGPRIGCLRINNFYTRNEDVIKIDSLFSELLNSDIEKLIIDLRFADGGDYTAGDKIFNYLTSEKYYWNSRTRVRNSEELTKQREILFDEYFLGMVSDDSIIDWSIPIDSIPKFQGQLYILSNEFSYSTAADFVAIVKDFSLGKIIGNETGGNRTSFGDRLSFVTPNFGLKFGVSSKLYYAPIQGCKDELRGTMPDIEFDEKAWTKYRKEEDPVLSFAIDIISNDK